MGTGDSMGMVVIANKYRKIMYTYHLCPALFEIKLDVIQCGFNRAIAL